MLAETMRRVQLAAIVSCLATAAFGCHRESVWRDETLLDEESHRLAVRVREDEGCSLFSMCPMFTLQSSDDGGRTFKQIGPVYRASCDDCGEIPTAATRFADGTRAAVIGPVLYLETAPSRWISDDVRRVLTDAVGVEQARRWVCAEQYPRIRAGYWVTEPQPSPSTNLDICAPVALNGRQE